MLQGTEEYLAGLSRDLSELREDWGAPKGQRKLGEQMARRNKHKGQHTESHREVTKYATYT